METKEYRTYDKSVWGIGPWLDEPDKIQWQDEATGLPCLIVRNQHATGALCGYVGVGEGHPDFEEDPSAIDDAIQVHGGITFARFCKPNADESRDICHATQPGESDHIWWFGFDCAHFGDIAPMMDCLLKEVGIGPARLRYIDPSIESYKTIDYVREQVTSLALQLYERQIAAAGAAPR